MRISASEEMKILAEQQESGKRREIEVAVGLIFSFTPGFNRMH